jgi:polyhydroxybutyrate depolymerase
VDGGRGPVNVYVSDAYDPETPAPLLMMLHGYGATGGGVEGGYFQFLPYADANGYIYTFPTGRQDPSGYYFWDALDWCCDIETPHGDEDSVYLRDFIEAIEEVVNVDPRRIYIVGHSNGGMMAYRMACDHSDKIAAAIPFAGAMYNPWNADDNPASGEDYCRPTQPVHVLHIHGTGDGTVLYEGGTLDFPDTPFHGMAYPGAETSIDLWRNFNMCSSDVEQSGGVRDYTLHPGRETDLTRWPSQCHLAGSAELWTMNYGSHAPSLTDTFRADFFVYLDAHPKEQIDFDDPSTIGWPDVPVAASYRMYRGDLADLVDTDDDGIPDQEYGTCASLADPDLTDTIHEDTEDPLPGEGFFYVLSYIDNVPLVGGYEGGLGKTSAGLHRVNSIQCP